MNKVLLYAEFNFNHLQIWIQSAFVYVICREIYMACNTGTEAVGNISGYLIIKL